MIDYASLFDENNQDGSETWHRQPNEPVKWYFLFSKYCRKGVTRSLLGTYNDERATNGHRKSLRISGGFEKRTKQFTWVERARAFDIYVEKLETQDWDRRRKETIDKELDFAKRLMEKAQQMLQFPVATTKTETTQDNGRTVVQTTFIPARWNFADAARIIEAASKLQRLALEMDTSRAAVDAKVEEVEDIEAVRQKRWQAITTQLAEALSEQDHSEEDIENGNDANTSE
jgi:hypothetical protein